MRIPRLMQKMGLMICLAMASSFNAEALTVEDATQIATEAYIFGYPLVTMDMTREVMTNTAKAGSTKAPMGQFANLKAFPTPAFSDVTTPNADTLYSVAWLDLTKEPYILHLPEMGDRYYLMPMLSGWTDVFADPGTRTTGTKEQKIAIVGPDWQGELPKDLSAQYQSPTNMVWILGRTYSTGTPKDIAIVNSLQEQFKLTPLSAYGKTDIFPEAKVDPKIDMNKPVRDQVNALDAKTFFNKLAILMQQNPPAKEDAPLVKKMAEIGLIPGKQFELTQLPPELVQAIEQSVKLAQEKINAHEKSSGTNINNWIFPDKVGNYGVDYLQRAYIAAYGLGANLPQDAIYLATKYDNEGNPLKGSNRYVMHFAKGQFPPVKGFWSLTMYNNHYFFNKNPINRYNLGSRDHLQKNPDGSVDIYIQHDSPGADKESNWLPAPEGDFVLMLRLYWPADAILNHRWVPPAISLVK